MAITLQEIRDFMERMGIPGRDLWELPTSTQTFPDGAHWRVEISGVERASTMEALIDEAGKRNLPIHRAIATVGGSTFLDFEELNRKRRPFVHEKEEIPTQKKAQKALQLMDKTLESLINHRTVPIMLRVLREETNQYGVSYTIAIDEEDTEWTIYGIDFELDYNRVAPFLMYSPTNPIAVRPVTVSLSTRYY